MSNAVAYATNDKKASINCNYDRSTRELEVSVSGKSKPIEEGIRVFEPLHDSTRQCSSLSICKQIIEKLEGKINYRSSLTGETIFFFRVPCREVEGEELV